VGGDSFQGENAIEGLKRSGIVPKGFLFMYGYIFWTPVGGESGVTQCSLRAVICEELNSPSIHVISRHFHAACYWTCELPPIL
jgi:hypothetical protein